jgi:hypothetical protein
MKGLSWSRIFTILGGLLAVCSEANVQLQIASFNPKIAHLLAVVGLVMTMMNERVSGGVSKLPRVPMDSVVAMPPSTPVVPIAPVDPETTPKVN